MAWACVMSSALFYIASAFWDMGNPTEVPQTIKKLFDPKAFACEISWLMRFVNFHKQEILSGPVSKMHWANLIHPQENPLRHVLYHKLPLPRSILKFFFLRELPQLVFGPGQSGSQFGVHYDNLDPPTGSSWKGSQLNSGDPWTQN